MDFPFVDFHTHRPATSGLHVLNLPRNGAFPTDRGDHPEIEGINDSETRWYCYGIHPWWVDDTENESLLLERLLNENRITMIGETGIDKAHPLVELQLKTLERHIALSESYQKPLVLHNVRGTSEILQMHKKHHPTQAWVVHGFNGTQEEARQLTCRGIHLSVGESLLYDNRKITISISSISLDHLFFETDEAAIPVSEVYRRASELMGIPLEVLKARVFANFKRILL